MKGIRFLTNEKNERVAVLLDLEHLKKHQAEIECPLDIIIAESRKNDESVNWNHARSALKSEGKLR